ncbi:MAG: T9SS type A sorting domain-containing protein, partial [Flavobacteriales bacterium]
RYLNNSDKMTLYVSTDCGQTWMPRWSQSGNGLATAATTSSSFVPSSNDWQQVNITLLSSQLAENVRFKFTFECDGGNNLYVDDINIDGNWDPVPILVSPPNAEINVADDVTIDWKAVNGVDEYEYQLDEVASFTSNNLQTGTNTYISNNPDNTDTEFNTSNLSWGQMYYWRVRSVTGGNPSAWAGPWHFTVSNDGIGMNEPKANISGFSVYPNPADRDVTVKFDLKKEDFVVLRITDILGKDVLRPVSRPLNAGPHLFNIERKLFPAGIYAITLTGGGATKTTKLILK